MYINIYKIKTFSRFLAKSGIYVVIYGGIYRD